MDLGWKGDRMIDRALWGVILRVWKLKFIRFFIGANK